MKTKSISGFIVGLISIILAAIISVYSYVVLGIIFSVAKVPNFYYVTLYANLISVAIGLIALFFYFKKAKIGGIIMLIAFIMNIALFVFAATLGTSVADMIWFLILGCTPSIMMFISATLAIVSKSQNNKTSETNNE